MASAASIHRVREPVSSRVRWRRLLSLAAALTFGCAMLPIAELAPAQVHYRTRTDWEGATFVQGHRVVETDLGYVVGVTTFRIRTTSLELVPCGFALGWDPRPRPAFAHGGDYEHDISAVEPSQEDDLMVETEAARGTTLATRALYCDLFTMHGALDASPVATLSGWIRSPSTGQVQPFAAEHGFALTELTELPAGVVDESLLPDEAEVVVTRYPARAFDGLELGSLPPLDLVYEVSRNLLARRDVSWSMGP